MAPDDKFSSPGRYFLFRMAKDPFVLPWKSHRGQTTTSSSLSLFFPILASNHFARDPRYSMSGIDDPELERHRALDQSLHFHLFIREGGESGVRIEPRVEAYNKNESSPALSIGCRLKYLKSRERVNREQTFPVRSSVVGSSVMWTSL